jgi:hypothetical protein
LREIVSYRDGGPKWHTASISFEDAMRTLLTLLFAVAGGLTLSGIVTDLYWLVARPTKSAKDGLFYWVVMAVAGPTVMIENSTRSFISKKAAPLVYMTVLGISIYWAFMIGLFGLAVYNVI